MSSSSDEDDSSPERPPDELTEEDLKHMPRRNTAGWGDTPLHAACGNDRVGVCRILAGRLSSSGVPLYAARSERDGASPLLRACEADSVGCIDALVAVGADINAQNNSGESPLYIALSRKNDEVARCVLKHGGKVAPREGQIMRRFTMLRRRLKAEASKAALVQQRETAASASQRTAAYDAEFGTTDFVAELERMKIEMGGGGAASGGGGGGRRGGSGSGESRAPQPKSEAQKAKAARRRKAKKAAAKAKKAALAAAAAAPAAPEPAAAAAAARPPHAAAVASPPPAPGSAGAVGAAALGAAAGGAGLRDEPPADVDEDDSEVDDYDEGDDIVLE